MGLSSKQATTAAILIAAAGAAWGQCAPTFRTLAPMNQGVLQYSTHGIVRAATSWDPDGEGPLGEWLVIAGEFDFVHGVSARNVAAWDGERWRSFNMPLIENFVAVTLCVHQGHLLLGGDFHTLDGVYTHSLMELVPDGWRLFNGRPGPGTSSSSGAPIQSLVSDGEKLYIGGAGVKGDDEPFATQVVAWDGERYAGMGLSLGHQEEVHALGLHQGALYATGRFLGFPTNSHRYIARFDGEEWRAVGDGLSRTGLSLTSDGGRLYVGLEEKNDNSPGVMAWDGETWEGVSVIGETPVHALRMFEGTLHAGGRQWTTQSFTLPVWAHEEDAWEPLEPGPPVIIELGNREVRALTVLEGDLIAGGTNQRSTLERYVGGVARWTGTTWTTVDHSLDGSVLALHEDGDGVLAVGEFTSIGGVFSPGIARLTSQGVEPFEAPLGFDNVDHVAVREVADWGDRLVLVGDFVTEDPLGPGVLVRESDGTWQTTPHGFEGFDGREAVGIGETLYVYARDVPGSSNSASVLAWNGESWNVLTSEHFVNLRGIGSHKSALIAHGNFKNVGGIDAPGIALYDGESWAPVGEGLDGWVHDVATHQGTLIAAGEFTIVENGESATLARWDGVQWRRIPTPTTAPVVIVRSVGGRLLVWSGSFSSAGHMLSGGRWVSLAGLGTTGAASDSAMMGDETVLIGLQRIRSASFGYPAAATLPCEADVTCDGSADILDLLEFLQAFSECSEGGACDELLADFDQNGEIDILDFLAFMDAFDRGC